MPIAILNTTDTNNVSSLRVDVQETAKRLVALKHNLIEGSDLFMPETFVVTLRLDRERDNLFRRHEAQFEVNNFVEEIKRSAELLGTNLRSRLCQYSGFDAERDFILLPYIHRAVFTIERENLIDLISSSEDLEWLLADISRNETIGVHDEKEEPNALESHSSLDDGAYSRMIKTATTSLYDNLQISKLRSQTDGKGQVIGILDTGIDSRHPVLSGKCIEFADFDRAGVQQQQAFPADYGCHGTKVCSLIVGHHLHGHTSIAPGAKVSVGRVLEGSLLQPTGTLAQVAAASNWLIREKVNRKQNISVANLSVQFFNSSHPSLSTTKSVLSDLKNFAQIQPVLAVGNHRRSMLADVGISVGSMDKSSGRASTFSASDPDILAPGEQLRCAHPPLARLRFRSFGRYNGTSLAAPSVSGVLALLLAATGRPIQDCVNALLLAAKQKSGQSKRDKKNGWGPLDGDWALQILTGTSGAILAP